MKPPSAPKRGRPVLALDVAQSAKINERVTPAQLAEYKARGGKAWLVRELDRKPSRSASASSEPARESIVPGPTRLLQALFDGQQQSDEDMGIARQLLQEAMPMDGMISDLPDYDIHVVSDLSDDWLRQAVFGDADSVSPCAEELAEFFIQKCDEYGMTYDQFDKLEQFQEYVLETAEAFIQQWRSRLIAAHPSVHGVTVAAAFRLGSHWLPSGLPLPLSVPHPSGSLDLDLYLHSLQSKLHALIQSDPQEALRCMEMSQEGAPELWAISQREPRANWAWAVVHGDRMASLLPYPWAGDLVDPRPTTLREMLEHLG